VPVKKKGNIGEYSKIRHTEHMKIMANSVEMYTCSVGMIKEKETLERRI
jgi:hypothetical protein